MAQNVEARLLKGFRDFLPEQMVVRQKVMSILKDIFEAYGFEPLETPTLEYGETLMGKYGEEADKLIYSFEDRGERTVGLRYDLTVPLSRVVAMYPNVQKPFKRYQIQPVWRADRPQKGRYREFTQCDIDIVGSSKPLADAEIIKIIYEVLKAIRFPEFTIRVNSRSVLFSIMNQAGVPELHIFSAIQSIDKLDKISEEEVLEEMVNKGIDLEIGKSILKQLSQAHPDDYLNTVISYAHDMGVDKEFLQFFPFVARGLDYYTGPIFETNVTNPRIGSVTGGGRYDKLVGMFSGRDIPSVGTSFGFDRIVDVISELQLWPEIKPTVTQAMIAIIDAACIPYALSCAETLRGNDFNIEVYLDAEEKLPKQLSYADKKGIPFVIIIGPDEMRDSSVLLKNLRTREQSKVQQSLLAESLQELLNKEVAVVSSATI